MSGKQKLTFISIICCCIFLYPSLMAADAFYPLQTKYPQTIMYKAETEEKIIALTFDDGPDTIHTPEILDILEKHHVRATFFLLGARVEKYPDIVKQIDEAGHVIGNHTYWHPDLTKTGASNMKWEIKKSEQAIINAIGKKPKLFRAPYGALNETLVSALPELGYRAVGWSIDSEDWKGLSKEKIKQQVINGLHPGSIVLMHSSGDVHGTVDALDELIPRLKKAGYHFVTPTEMWQVDFK